ncbi:MAG TPA: IS200/IS605 family transposase [Terracidiphilus sp.]
MAHTYASNFIHCIFSTKDRQRLIADERMPLLFDCLGGVAKSEGFTLAAAGGTADHVHLLLLLPATHTVAHAVQKLKGSSSRWMGSGFAWQEGYGAFSVSPSQVAVIKTYIRNQQRHHQKRSFEEGIQRAPSALRCRLRPSVRFWVRTDPSLRDCAIILGAVPHVETRG